MTHTAENDAPADGFCPTCGALDDQACCTPSGAARPDHHARHPYPTRVTPPETTTQKANP